MQNHVLGLIVLTALTGCHNWDSPKDQRAGEYNIFVTGGSTYPRSVITGLIASNSADKNNTFDLYFNNAKPHQVAENVFVKGYIPSSADGHPTPNTKDSGDDPTLPDPDNNEEMTIISKKIIEVPEGVKVNLIVEDSFPRNSKTLLTSEALERLKSITIILEGSGALNPESYRLMQTVELAKQAQDFGVPEFNVQTFSSVNTELLANGDGENVKPNEYWKAILDSDYINIKPVSFSQLGSQISKGYETDVYSSLLTSFGYDLSKAFVASPDYDKNKGLLVFFGSSRNNASNQEVYRQGGNYNNVILLDYLLGNKELTSKYNIAVKPHPALAWINTYIEDNKLNASYFSSMPYELLALASGKEINGFTIPKINRVDSTYSTILYSVDKENIGSIIDYSPYIGFTDGDEPTANQKGLTGEEMKASYTLESGWAIERYEYEATALTHLIDAPQIEVTNVYEYIHK